MLAPAALDDLVVLDISQGIAGPLCARLLGDYGADVIKIEPPGGEPGRSLPPFHDDTPGTETSLFFAMANLNKRGIVLDLESEEGAEQFRRLARRADIIVESFAPGHLAALRLDREALSEENPGLIVVSITPFGQTGPYSGYKGNQIVAYATSGIMSISGTKDREPLQHGGFPAEYEAALNGMLAANVAVLARDMTGFGQHVDVSVQEVVASSLIITQPCYSFAGGIQDRRRPGGNLFGNVMPCKDGYFISQEGAGATWEDIADFYQREELKGPRYATPTLRAQHSDEIDAIILDAAKDRTMAEMFKLASEKYRMVFGIAQTPEDLSNCPQLDARGFYEQVEHPVVGAVSVPFKLWNMGEASAMCCRRSPLLGEHTQEVLAEFDARVGEAVR